MDANRTRVKDPHSVTYFMFSCIKCNAFLMCFVPFDFQSMQAHRLNALNENWALEKLMKLIYVNCPLFDCFFRLSYHICFSFQFKRFPSISFCVLTIFALDGICNRRHINICTTFVDFCRYLKIFWMMNFLWTFSTQIDNILVLAWKHS